MAAELNDPGEFPEGALTAKEIAEMRKKAGLPSGRCSVQQWIADRVGNGTMERIEGHITVNGRKQRAVKYVLKK